MRYLVLILSLLSLSMNVPSAVADESTKRAKIENIIKMWKLDEEFRNYKDACVSSYNLGSPEILVRNNPDHFDGIKPGSPDWDKIVIAWNKYVDSSCGFMNAKRYKEEVINSLASQLDETDTDEILRFYSTKSGKAYLAAQNTTSMKMQKYYKEIASAAAKTAYDTYTTELKKITTNYTQKQR